MSKLSQKQWYYALNKAKQAPSVHNTQPAKWRLKSHNEIELYMSMQRTLAIGDPELRDAKLSCGASLEGMRMALQCLGYSMKDLNLTNTIESENDLRQLLSLQILPLSKSQQQTEPLNKITERRQTYRAGFATSSHSETKSLEQLLSTQIGVKSIIDKKHITKIAELNDQISVQLMVSQPYRYELLSWLRLSKKHPNWSTDGLNAEALAMQAYEAKLANIIMRKPYFDILQRLSLAAPVFSEKSKTLSASAIVLFYRPMLENPISSGTAFYNLLLAMTAIGFSAWPMAALADHEGSNAELCKTYGIPNEYRLINVLRVGMPKAGNRVLPKARLALSDLAI